jgi:cation transport regulator ChaB
MPYYADLTYLPEDIREALPLPAQVIYADAFNQAWEEDLDSAKLWLDREASARKEAWAAVKKMYRKDHRTGRWLRRGYRFLPITPDGAHIRPGPE